jgi:GNAT superfamily N-acetyltransferase
MTIMDNLFCVITDGNREIKIGEDGNSIVAEYNLIRIGEANFDICETNQEMLLTNIGVDKEFRGLGIATELLKAGEEFYGSFCIVDHLSEEGAGLLNYCQDNGLFKFEHKLVQNNNF